MTAPVSRRILVVNPNSSEAVTAGISRAVNTLRVSGGPRIDCLTLAEGPPGIETQMQVESVVAPLLALLRRETADAAVIACFSDPGLHAAREVLGKPVFGIAESALLAALTLGERVGIVAILAASVPRHRRTAQRMGISSRFADSLPIGLGVTELADEKVTLRRMVETGRRLRDDKGADVLVMGCAGMAGFREHLCEQTGLPVVEPSQAATVAALGAVLLAG